MKNQYNYIKLLGCLACMLLAAGITSCKKALDVGTPKTLVNTANVYTSNTTAQAVISGLYAAMSNTGGMCNGPGSITIQEGLAADELKYTASAGGGNALFYTNNLNNQSLYYWPEIFSELFTCNSAVAGLTAPSASVLNPAVRQHLLGYAKFARAFIFFNSVNLYGDFPLVLSVDAEVNNSIKRSPSADVLKQVIQDLTDAQGLLPDNQYVRLDEKTSPAPERTLPNKQAASALLARVYLYMKDWKNAEAQASNVISASSYILEPQLGNVFLKSSRETIWQIQSTNTSFANADAGQFVIVAVPNGLANNYSISDTLRKSFETGDNRFTSWVGKFQAGTATYYFPYKYKQNTAPTALAYNEYPIMFRLAEQFLIRAEARAQQNNVSGAQADLKTIRNRAGLGDPTATTQADLLTAVYHERQIELFTEFGHRWFDLKRTGKLDAQMTGIAPIKGGAWSSYKALIPIPASEIVINPNLTQNQGY